MLAFAVENLCLLCLEIYYVTMQFVQSYRNWTGTNKLAKIKTKECTAVHSFMYVLGCICELAGFVHCSLNRS